MIDESVIAGVVADMTRDEDDFRAVSSRCAGYDTTAASSARACPPLRFYRPAVTSAGIHRHRPRICVSQVHIR